MPSNPKAPSLPVAMRRWNALSQEQQLAIVRDVCRRRGAALMKRFDGILAVGTGYKKSDNAVSETICLGMLVKKKRARNIARPVPERVLISIVRDGKRIRLSVPTDIEELGKGRPHATVNVAQGVRAFNRNNLKQGVPGAACCVVVDANQPTNRFILGCHHVLALSLLTTGCTAFNATDVADRGMSLKFGQLYFPLPMVPNGQPCLDGAIAHVDPSISVEWVSNHGVKPIAVEPGVQQPRDCFIFTPNGPLPAVFVKEWSNVPLPYAQCGTVVIAGAYQFHAATVGGHSGSPVMTPDGILFGMHFWGDPSQNLAMAIPAFMLFQPGRFPVEIRLA